MPDRHAAEQIRREAISMLKEGRLHPDAWAQIDDMLLNGEVAEARAALDLQVVPTPIYPPVPSPREGQDA